MPRSNTNARATRGSTRRREEPREGPPGLDFDSAVGLFIEYLRTYRGYSILTVTSYGTDLRQFREFLERRLGRVPAPDEIQRETVVQFAASLAGKAAWTVRRKIACLSAFYGYLMDMGHVHHNPAHRVPLPKVALQDEDLLTQGEDQAIAVVSKQAQDHDVHRSEQYRQRVPEHGDRMSAARAEVNGQE